MIKSIGQKDRYLSIFRKGRFNEVMRGGVNREDY